MSFHFIYLFSQIITNQNKSVISCNKFAMIFIYLSGSQLGGRQTIYRGSAGTLRIIYKQSCHGMILLVNEPTRGGNLLDRLFVSRPSYTNVKIHQPSNRTTVQL